MNFDLTRRKFIKLTGATTIMAATVPTLAARALGDSQVNNILWSIGTTNHSSSEFGRGSGTSLTYNVAEKPDAKQWHATQKAKQVYNIRFDLDDAFPALLAIEAYLIDPGPNEIELVVNGKRGRFRLIPKYAKDIDMLQGRVLTHDGVSVRAPIDA